MTENNVPNHIPNNMDVIVVIDKEKLPEDVRKLLEENLPKDVSEQLKLSQEKVLKMLSRLSPASVTNIENKSNDKSNDKPDNETGDISKDNRLFTVQTGTVVGNIYTNGIYKKEELELKRRKMK